MTKLQPKIDIHPEVKAPEVVVDVVGSPVELTPKFDVHASDLLFPRYMIVAILFAIGCLLIITGIFSFYFYMRFFAK